MKIYNHTFRGLKTLHFLDRKGFILSFDCYNLGHNRAGWFLSDQVECEIFLLQPPLRDANRDLKKWIFDSSWYDQIDLYETEDVDADAGAVGIFKILAESNFAYQEKYLHIYNRHDGNNPRHFDFSDKEDELLEVGDL